MLFTAATLDGIVAGTITAVLRRWEKPRTVDGSLHRTAVGIVAVTSIDALDELTEPDARAAGFATVAEALASTRPEGTLFRIGVRFAGVDPRIALRDSAIDDSVRPAIERLDAAAEQPWTEAVLRLIAAQPGVPAAVLATQLGEERDRFKRRVRRLKELGLTESLEVGYRLSPRGRALLAD